MVNFNDIPEGGSSNLKFGINELTLASIVRQEGDPDKKIGPNLNFVFTNTYEHNGETKEGKNFYTYYLRGAFAADEGWKMKTAIKQLVDVRAVVTGTEEAEEFFKTLSANAPGIDNEDAAACYEWEEKFVMKLLEPCLGKLIPCVLHYKGKYLNMPTAKENAFKLPFGLNPFMSDKLNTEPPVDTTKAEAEEAAAASAVVSAAKKNSTDW